MRRALNGHMSLSYKYYAEDDDIMQEGMTIKEWKAKYSGVCAGLFVFRAETGNVVCCCVEAVFN